jgi:D-alanyl-D-alanine carboxypeptidase/D-alanyl-D-alanine-endopeptidase (penicillin-binding protein 4)
VSALTLNDNAFTLWVRPGLRVGDPAQLSLSPRMEELTIHNRTRTTEAGEKDLEYKRMAGSQELIVSGIIPLQSLPEKTLLAVADPARFAAHALLDALRRRGIEVRGEATVRHRRGEDSSVSVMGLELARHESLPLIEALRVIDKESQNLHAEMILREVARRKTGVGSRAAGIEEMRAFLSEVGVELKQYNFEDGSGLSRLTLVTPLTVSKLLAYMYSSKYREEWVKLLPVGGEDGTLKRRFRDGGRSGAIHAKTGTLSHVTSLSGYMLPAVGKTYAFSILVNNYNGPASEVRGVLDKIAVSVLNGN